MFSWVWLGVLAATPSFVVDGGLSLAEVKEVIEYRQAELSPCFPPGKAKQPGLVRYRFEVQPGGGVKLLSFIEQKGVPGTSVTCVGTALERWPFPAADAGTFAEWSFTAPRDGGLVEEEAELPDEATLERWDEDVRECDDRIRAGNRLDSRLSAELVFARSGARLDTTVELSPSRDQDFERCIVATSARWRVVPAATLRRLMVRWVFAENERRAKLLFRPDEPARELLANVRPPATKGDGLPRAHIKRVLDGQRRPIRLCFEDAMNRDGISGGLLRVHFRIGPDGKVAQQDVVDDSLKNERMTACILNVVRGLEFDPPRGGGSVEVTFPWLFKTTEQE